MNPSDQGSLPASTPPSSTPPAPVAVQATIRRGGGLSPRVFWVILLVLAIAFAVRACAHHENANERLVRQITVAVQSNDMTPVAKEFNAITREKLTRASVGRLSDQLAPLGKIKSVEETTPKDASPRHHTFTVHFEKADWRSHLVLDEDGKVAAFDLRPMPS